MGKFFLGNVVENGTFFKEIVQSGVFMNRYIFGDIALWFFVLLFVTFLA